MLEDHQRLALPHRLGSHYFCSFAYRIFCFQQWDLTRGFPASVAQRAGQHLLTALHDGHRGLFSWGCESSMEMFMSAWAQVGAPSPAQCVRHHPTEVTGAHWCKASHSAVSYHCYRTSVCQGPWAFTWCQRKAVSTAFLTPQRCVGKAGCAKKEKEEKKDEEEVEEGSIH